MEREDFQTVVDLTSEALGLRKPMPVRIKNVLKGMANKQYITIPKWIENYDELYQIYYAIHETCHYLMHNKNHKDKFKKDEDRALALWGMSIIRKKAYPKSLCCNGQSIKNIPGGIKNG